MAERYAAQFRQWGLHLSCSGQWRAATQAPQKKPQAIHVISPPPRLPLSSLGSTCAAGAGVSWWSRRQRAPRKACAGGARGADLGRASPGPVARPQHTVRALLRLFSVLLTPVLLRRHPASHSHFFFFRLHTTAQGVSWRDPLRRPPDARAVPSAGGRSGAVPPALPVRTRPPVDCTAC